MGILAIPKKRGRRLLFSAPSQPSPCFALRSPYQISLTAGDFDIRGPFATNKDYRVYEVNAPMSSYSLVQRGVSLSGARVSNEE